MGCLQPKRSVISRRDRLTKKIELAPLCLWARYKANARERSSSAISWQTRWAAINRHRSG